MRTRARAAALVVAARAADGLKYDVFIHAQARGEPAQPWELGRAGVAGQWRLAERGAMTLIAPEEDLRLRLARGEYGKRTIADDDLELEDIPEPTASWGGIGEFALT